MQKYATYKQVNTERSRDVVMECGTEINKVVREVQQWKIPNYWCEAWDFFYSIIQKIRPLDKTLS